MKTKLTVVGAAALMVLLGTPRVGLAQCQGTQINPLVAADGTPVVETIAGGAVRLYFTHLNAGRSYSLQALTSQRIVNGPEYTLVLCATEAGGVATTTDTTLADPSLGSGTLQGGRRLSIRVSSTGRFVFDFTNTDNTTHPFTVVLVETTLYNPAWSTFGTFETFYSCVNTTNDGTLDATLKLFDTMGAEAGSFDFIDVPAGGTVSRNTGATSLNVANSLNGSATLTHNGPPGALKCEAAIADFATAPRVIQPVKFEPARQ